MFRSLNSFLTDEQATDGFTLLEVLLAVSILLIMMSIIYASLFGSLDAMEHTRNTVDLYERARLCLTLMEQDIQSAYSSPYSETILFKGTNEEHDGEPADTMIFCATTHHRMLRDAPETDLCEVTYAMMFSDRGDEPGRLMRRTDPTLDADPEMGGTTWELLDDVAGVNFDYYNGQDWVETWDVKGKNARLPKIVRVRLILMNELGENREFTDLIAPVLAQ